MATRIEYVENELGIAVPVEVSGIVKREKMTRTEWRAYFYEEEITEEEFRKEYARLTNRPLDV